MGRGLQFGVSGIRVFKVMKPEQGARIHDTITRPEYKEDNGDFLKVKARMCVREDQQIAGVSFKETDLYTLCNILFYILHNI